MLYKTRGVVFRFTKYGESSIIVNIFTELFGIRSYIVNGVRTKSARSKIALYQPLTLLDLVVYHRENANILRIKEIKCVHPYTTIFSDVKKSTLAMFINEIVNKSIREESHAQELCDFLVASLITLDELTQAVENFHLIFLIKLSRFLGFGALNVNDLLAGKIIDKYSEDLLDKLINTPYEVELLMSNAQRREILELLLKFYNEHLEIGELKSLPVLREILS